MRLANPSVSKAFTSLLMIAVIVALPSLPASGQDDKIREALFREADGLIKQCMVEETALYAPVFFDKAMKIYKDAEQVYKKGERIDRINRELAKTADAFKQALAAAEKSAPVLREAYTARKSVMRRNFGPAEPTLFARAESALKKAVRDGENGNLKQAEKNAKEASVLYGKVAMTALQKNVIKKTEKQLDEQKAALDQGEYKLRVKDLDILKEDLKILQGKTFDIDRVSAQIENEAVRIAGLPLTGQEPAGVSGKAGADKERIQDIVIKRDEARSADAAGVRSGELSRDAGVRSGELARDAGVRSGEPAPPGHIAVPLPVVDQRETGSVFLWQCPRGHLYTGETPECGDCSGTVDGEQTYAEWHCPRCQHVWLSRTATCPECGNGCTPDDVILARICPNGHMWIGTVLCGHCSEKGKPEAMRFKCPGCVVGWAREKHDELQAKKKSGELVLPEQARAILDGPGSPKWEGVNPVCQKCRRNVFQRKGGQP